ncbi:carboxylate-amine ligase [Baekduia sp. Peel2402]|uniref:carboxylate-amine ligase n=1 Tax=Baekduia sp. Peel2402 TaxID=3458296 RepID=UPI00403E6257
MARRHSGDVCGVHAIADAFGPAARPLTIGLEEELMLLDPVTLDLTPCAADVLERLKGDPRYVPEQPAAQLEIVVPPAATVGEAIAELAVARVDLARVVDGLARLAGGGVHPFAAGLGAVAPGARYAALLEEYGDGVMRRQLAFGLHVHVALGGPGRVLPVYDALREELPAIAALAAASPFYEGVDTGLASFRPKLAELLPRQGVPPELPSWDAYAEALRWPARSFADACWWWELRPHPVHGTLEVRVADTQTTVADTAAVAAVVHALVATLAERHDAGELPAPAPTWRIAENRWSACRHGVRGTWTDPRTGLTRPMAARLHDLLDALAPAAERLCCASELEAARDLVERPRAESARALGPQGLAAAAAARFLAPTPSPRTDILPGDLVD